MTIFTPKAILETRFKQHEADTLKRAQTVIQQRLNEVTHFPISVDIVGFLSTDNRNALFNALIDAGYTVNEKDEEAKTVFTIK